MHTVYWYVGRELGTHCIDIGRELMHTVYWYIRRELGYSAPTVHAIIQPAWTVPFFFQWSYGVTCWELFTGGKIPYPGVDPVSLPSLLESGHRLDKPENAACSEEMLVLLAIPHFTNRELRSLVNNLPSSNLLCHVIHLRINHSTAQYLASQMLEWEFVMCNLPVKQ